MTPRDITNLVHATVKECTNLFKANGWASSSWSVKVVASFSTHRNRSWGGTRRGNPFISLSLNKYVGTALANFVEYKSFARDPEIGSVMSNTVNAIRALVAHEMCHAIQFSGTSGMAASVGALGDCRGHGMLWKSLYRIARKAIVNGNTKTVNELTSNVVQLVKSSPVQPATNTVKRAEALRLIATWKHYGYTRSSIIAKLVTEYGFKKTTATTYTYTI